MTSKAQDGILRNAHLDKMEVTHSYSLVILSKACINFCGVITLYKLSMDYLVF